MWTSEECTVRVLGEPPWQELDCSNEPLTDDMRILLWVIDGAERRQELAAEWSGQSPRRQAMLHTRLRR